MIAITSRRPLGEHPEYDSNQANAALTWQTAFERVQSFDEPFPTIKTLMEYAAQQPGWSCLINADICVPMSMRAIERRLDQQHALCAASWRFNFTPPYRGNATMTDLGLDFFAAKPEVWKAASERIPGFFRIGHNLWDTWLLAFFRRHYLPHFWDLSPCRVILHPVHGGRRQIYEIPQHQIVFDGPALMPPNKIKL